MVKFFPIFLIFFIFFLTIPRPITALTQIEKTLLLQQIEILKREIQVLQSLIFNLQLKQEINAASYLAIDLSDGSVILKKNINQSYPIASLTKLMNAVVTQENIEKNQTIILTKKMLEPLGRSPSLFPESSINAENLLRASLIQSANDASEALAYFLGKDRFLSLMNQKAKELEMENTVFSDVHGLNPANRSSAADLAKLVTYIYQQHPEILQITRDNNFWLPDSDGRLLKFQNVNNFYPLNEFIGGKTGYLPQTKQTLASVFQVNKKFFAVILLRSNNRQADAFTILNQLKK